MTTDFPGSARPVEITTDVLDCVQANLAAVANALHDDRREHRLGASLLFPRATRADGTLPSVELTLDEQLDNAAPLLGLSHGAPQVHPSAAAAAESLSDDWMLLVADAYEMPWVPYHGQRHTGHSVALRRNGSDVELLDAYTNSTPWGDAVPAVWTFPERELGDVLPHGPAAAVTLGACPDSVPDGTGVRRDRHRAGDDLRDDIARYGEAFAAHDDLAVALDHLTVETWLLSRCRAAHARWLESTDDGADPQQAADRAAAWSAQSEATYVAMRRAARGRALPHDVFGRVVELLLDDLALLDGGPADTPAASGADGVVVATASRVLGVDPAELTRDPDLTRFPTYTSFRVLDIVESVEQELSVEVDPADLVPEKLRHLDAVCAMFAGGPR